MSKPQSVTENIVDRTAAAAYVAELAADLAKVARQDRLDALAYILDMAKLEAETATRDGKRQS
jgi:uncharacterized protein (DUF433 family)